MSEQQRQDLVDAEKRQAIALERIAAAMEGKRTPRETKTIRPEAKE